MYLFNTCLKDAIELSLYSNISLNTKGAISSQYLGHLYSQK